MAGRPALMAPELTTTTRWPAPRKAATSVHSLSMPATEISPWLSVTDDVPTLETTITGPPSAAALIGRAATLIRSPSARSWRVLELVGADPDGVALAGTGPGEGPVDT